MSGGWVWSLQRVHIHRFSCPGTLPTSHAHTAASPLTDREAWAQRGTVGACPEASLVLRAASGPGFQLACPRFPSSPLPVTPTNAEISDPALPTYMRARAGAPHAPLFPVYPQYPMPHR